MPLFIWPLIAAAVLFLLQLTPAVGILLMLFGGSIWTGMLIAIALAVLAVEAIIRRVPRWLLIVPISAVAAYYGVMAYEWQRLSTVPAELGLRQASTQLQFDPVRHAIGQFALDPNYLLAAYEIEWVYDNDFTSRRAIGKTRSCELLSYSGSKKNAPGAPLGIRVRDLNQVFCFTIENDVQIPVGGRIVVDSRYSRPIHEGAQVSMETLTVSLDDNAVGSIATVTAGVLKPLPQFLVGCGLNSARPSWECGAGFMRDDIEVWPRFGSRRNYLMHNDTRQRQTDEIATLLGLTPRTPAEIEAITRLP